ncbi:hypothetical protein G6F37_004143 [Rhizopus arrhizus]|nr:hypothetical protein G6F38_000413 [Rhizopus arrhizus]KAG1160274.1 hypothetical protein G6F37_004143 [Rhizopus arrhizus]
MERPKRQSAIEKDYRERKRQKKGDNNEKSATPPIITTTIREDPQSLFEQLYKDVVNYRDPEDEEYDIIAIFMKLPSKKEYPDYYQIIRHPIALETIKSKIDKKVYQHISQMKADIELMVSNAKRYNVKSSQIYEDAVKIQKFVKGWQGVKEKTVLKLPGDAFNSAPKIKTIRLKAIDKPKKSSENMKLLMNAINKKDTKKALELLELDSQLDPNELVPVEMFNDKFTWSPLHAACYNGDLKLIEILIAKGADIELHDTWHSATPLGWAAFGDKEKVVKVLIQKYNADKKAKNVHGQVPFDLVSDQSDSRWIGLFKDPPPSIAPVQEKTTTSQQQTIPAPPPPLQQQQQQPMPVTQLPISTIHPQPIKTYPTIPGVRMPVYETTPDGSIRKRRGRPPKSETDALAVRPTTEIDINTFDPVAFEIELFNAIRTHTDNSNRLYSELFEDLPDRQEYPEYYKTIKNPRSLTEVAERMQTRSYPNLYAWMSDMKLVFENALKFNEPGSRIFRDAKLLLRLLHRLKERILARLGVPVSQEDAIMRLDLASRPFDVDALSEDKRKIKRFLTTSKSRTQSIEPDYHHHPYQQPMVHPLLLQQQQQQQQQTFLQSPFLMPPPQSLPANVFPQPPPAMMSIPPNMMLQQPTPIIESPTEQPKLPLGKASKEFYAVFTEEGVSYLDELRISGKEFEQRFDGDYLGHSMAVSSDIQTLIIQTELLKPLKQEEKRMMITVFQNNLKLNPTTKNHEWTTVPLNKGVNVIKIHVTANISQPESSLAEYKSQIYHLFITQAW